MDFWEYHFKKACENIQLSKKLHSEKQFGLSAFHAQQGLEIAIKSFCYKKEIHEIFSSKNALKTHLPSHVLITKYFNYLIDVDNRFDRRSRSTELEMQINTIIIILEKLKKILEDLKDHNNSKMKQIWKYSLGIMDNSKIQQELEEIKELQNTIPVTFFNEALENYRNYVIDMIDSQKFIKQKQKVQKAIEIAKKRTKKLGFSDDIVNSFVTRNSFDWKSEITSYVIKQGAIKAFDKIMGEDGLFSNITHKDAHMRENFLSIRWLAWVGLISPSIIYAFPHEQIGRYPIMIDNKNSEKWYEEKEDELKSIIDDCAFGIDRINDMINQK